MTFTKEDFKEWLDSKKSRQVVARLSGTLAENCLMFHYLTDRYLKVTSVGLTTYTLKGDENKLHILPDFAREVVKIQDSFVGEYDKLTASRARKILRNFFN